MRILLIDDNVAMTDALKNLLELEGHIVHTAITVEAGLILVSSVPTDVVILDYVLPGRDGMSFLKDFRAMGRREPVIILTALATQDLIEVSTKVTGYYSVIIVQKPVDPKDLIGLLEKLRQNIQGEETLKG